MAWEPARSAKQKTRLVLGMLAVLLVAATFAAASPWIKAMIGSTMLAWAGAVLALFVVASALHAAIRWHRGQDEVQKASAEFAGHWGMAAGTMAFVLLLVLPPSRDLLAAFIIDLRDPAPGVTVDRKAVILALMTGFVGVVLLQTLGTIVVSAFWWKSKQ